MPTCLGCLLNPNFINQPNQIHENQSKFSLNFNEREILKFLGKAVHAMNCETWNETDKNEFLKAIHDAQKVVGLQVAKRNDPEVWI